MTSNDLGRRSIAWLAGVVVLMAMRAYFALKVPLVTQAVAAAFELKV